MKEISSLIGPPRWYHLIVWSLTFVRAFPSSWTQFAALFVAADVEHWCSRPRDSAFANWTEQRWKAEAIPVINNSLLATDPKYESCRMYPAEALIYNASAVLVDQSRTVSCDAWSYNESTPGSSAVPEWDLVCQHEWQRSMMTSVVFVGSLVGSLVMGHMSDRFGRRTVFFFSVFGAALFGSLGAVSPSVKWYNTLRFFACINIAGIQTSSAALLTEILDPRFRTFLNIGYTAGFAIPSMLLPGVAYLLSDWKLLQLVSGLVALACVPFMIVIQESPRWLITIGREEQAERAISKILKMNRRKVPNLKSTMHVIAERIRASSTSVFGPIEILRHRLIRRNTFLLFVVWFCDNFLMFAVTLGAVDIEGSHLVNFTVSTAAEIPAAFVGLVMVYYCRRKPSQAATLIMAGIAAAAVELTPPGLSMSMAGRFVLTLSASVKWVWTMELFPTAARAFGFAACFTVGRVAGIMAPFMSVLKKQASVYVAAALLATAAVIGAAAATFLPETRGIELPDTFDEAEEVAKKRTKARDYQLTTVEASEERIQSIATTALMNE
ncbi:organic cation/carnitine transporter 2-like isoform X2 [Dermacentor andersoni]|uniref:organic cation/carnitine transporter 2-like isoform X2 n=1 Tax=Dermacentor andersoni TaxID=34620 RepID=UPI002417631F|nr:organic cation/carnitine transporter 2-like isoform X2 [Dermacentor andersoni]